MQSCVFPVQCSGGTSNKHGFCLENKNLFKNLNSLTSQLSNVYVRTYSVFRLTLKNLGSYTQVFTVIARYDRCAAFKSG